MKQILLTSIFLMTALLSQSQNLLCSWHFDTLHASPNTQTINLADSGLQDGVAGLYLDGSNGSSAWTVGGTTELNGFGGTTLNDGRITPFADSAIAVVNSSANGKSIVFKFSMTNYENPVLSFATRGTSTGFNQHIYQYSTDGVTFTPFDTLVANTTSTWTLETVDLSAINAVDGAASVYIRIIFNGASSSTGNNRLDNISIVATSTSATDIIPPTVVAATAVTNTMIIVKFSEAVGVSAENTANYTGVGTLVSATRTAGLDSVNIVLSTPLTAGIPDTICIDNIADTAGNFMTTGQCFQVVYGTIDNTPPTALSAWPLNLSTVKVKFSEAVDQVTAETTSNYTGLAGIGTASLSSSLDTVTLTLSTPLISGVADTLYIQSVEDTAGNVMAAQQMFVLLLDTSTTAAAIVITEIMYNPPESGTDSLEFIELYNNGSTDVNLLNYTLSYSSTNYTFTTPEVVPAGGYFLIGIKAAKANAFYGVPFFQGPTSGLTNNPGTFIRLINGSGMLVDTVSYLNASPWPVEAAGQGYSLSLCDPNLDNNVAGNWSIGHNAFGVINTYTVYADPGEGCTPATDTAAPIPTSAWATNFTTVKVRFNEPVDQISGENTANYTGLGSITNALLGINADTVTLTLATPLVSGVPQVLSVSNISDLNANTMSQVYNFNILLDTSSTSAALVITEIMYNPPESGTDSLEFIEIYNNDAVAVDLLNYKISYGTTFKVFNTSYSIAPGEYAIIAVNPSAVDAFYGVSSIAGPTVGISNGGTFIKLNSPSGLLVDSVSYMPASPWPVEANGGGASLTLCDPNTDNSDVNNWSASTNLVGVIATVNVYADPNDNCTPDAVAEFPETTLSLFPNPASDRMSIAVPENASVISIFNNMGMLVTTINAMPSSVQEMDISGLSSGLYYLNLQLNNGENITGSFMIVR